MKNFLIDVFIGCALALAIILIMIGKAWPDENDYCGDKTQLSIYIAKMYGLSRDQTVLLLAIREHENGGPGLEFGIESIPCEWKEGRKSFLINCARACETIRNRTPPKINHLSILKLGKLWAVDKSWHVYVYRNFKKYQKNILY
jgi:hypothetical protein